MSNEGENGSVRVERLVRRERDAKLVMLRTIVEAYKFYGNQVNAWRDVSSISGADTEVAELDLLAVQSEAERLMEQMRVEIKMLGDA